MIMTHHTITLQSHIGNARFIQICQVHFNTEIDPHTAQVNAHVATLHVHADYHPHGNRVFPEHAFTIMTSRIEQLGACGKSRWARNKTALVKMYNDAGKN